MKRTTPISALLLAMMLVWLAGGTIPFVAMSPAWTYYLMTGTNSGEMTGIPNWQSASFIVNNYSCFAYLAFANSSIDYHALKITVFDSAGTNVCNLTYNFSLGASFHEVAGTFQTATYDSTNQILAFTIYNTTTVPTNTYLSVYSLLCNGTDLSLLYSKYWGTVVGGGNVSAAWMTDLVSTSYGIYAAASIRSATTLKYYAVCFTHDYMVNIATDYGWTFSGYPGILALADDAVYILASKFVGVLDTTTDSYSNKTFSSAAYSTDGIDNHGTQGFIITGATGSTAEPQIYFQNILTLNTGDIVFVSCYYDGITTTLHNDNVTISDCKDAAFYTSLPDYSAYIGFVYVNTSGGIYHWVQAFPTINGSGKIISMNYTTLGTVESSLQTANHFRWTNCWHSETTGYPLYAVGYYNTTDDSDDYYYKVAELGSITLVNWSMYSFPVLSGTYENDTYTASSNELRLYTRTVTESFTNQMLTGVFIYLTNVNDSLQVGAYHTLTATDTTAYRIAMTTISAGWSGWVMFTGLSYSQPQGTKVSIAILPSNLSASANYSIGVPVATLSTDVYNATQTMLPASIASASLTQIMSGENKAITYGLSYTAGGTNYTYVNVETENITVPVFIVPVVQNATAVMNYTTITAFGWVGSIFARAYNATGGWGQYAFMILPILLMLFAGRHYVAVVGGIACGLCAYINYAIGASIYSTAILGIIALVCLFDLFYERDRP